MLLRRRGPCPWARRRAIAAAAVTAPAAGPGRAPAPPRRAFVGTGAAHWESPPVPPTLGPRPAFNLKRPAPAAGARWAGGDRPPQLLHLHCQRRGLSSSVSAGGGGAPGPLTAYMQLVEGKKIELNEQQLGAVRQLQRVYEEVLDFARSPDKYSRTSYRFVDFGIKKEVVVAPPKGLYLYGGVGTGKTFLMDLFYEQAPVKRKRRVHFNQFMLEVHERLHRIRQGGHRVQDPLALVIDDLHAQAWLLCFDEFQVTDVADAMVLKRLLSGLLAKGTVVVATSNRPPDDLYLHGLQRDLFLPFIALLKETHAVHDIALATDYRLVHRGYGLAADALFVHRGKGQGQWKGDGNETKGEKDEEDEARYGFNEALKHATKGQALVPVALPLAAQGRRLHCPKVALSTRTVLFSFPELCGQALGPADYIALASTFATVFLADVPRLSLNDANRLRRFITLVDCLYEHRVQLVLLAAAPPRELFDAQANRESAQDEVFAYDRTVSRLMEMQGADYRRHHGSHRAETADGAALVAKALKGKKGDGEDWWDAPGGPVWKFYDIDGAGTWGEAKLRAFLEDFAEATLTRRGDAVPASLVKRLLPSVATPEGFEALMNEGQGATVIAEALKKKGAPLLSI